MEKDNCLLSWEEIQALPSGAEKCRMLLSYASQAMRQGEDYYAARALSDAIAQISWENPGADAPLLESAYRGLCELTLSHDECAFELASQAAGDYSQFKSEAGRE